MPDLTTQQLQSRIHELEAEVKKLNLMLQKDSKMKYGLRWIDVPEAFEKESENSIPILEEVKENAISNDDGKPTHVLIEGDNFHALKCLNYTHKGKIDVIYIDPPYNTENGFVYHDKRVMDKFPDGVKIDVNHPLRHSAWLSFMSKRLELAKNLLSEKGIIFISIDDNEQANLRLLCNQIFGEKNFVADIAWQRTYSIRNDSKGIPREVEHILVYSKNTDWQPKKLPRTVEMNSLYKNPDNDIKPWTSSSCSAPGAITHQGMVYAIQHPFNGELMYPTTGRCWALGQDGMLENLSKWCEYELRDINDKEKRAEICGVSKDEIKKNVKAIMLKKSLEESSKKAKKVLENGAWPYFYFTNNGKGGLRRKTYLDDVNGRLSTNFFSYEETGHTDEAKKEIIEIFGGNAVFDTPKPTRLIERILQLSTVNSQFSIILDFFAGSGTTLHATMKLNESDGGNRQCILVQQDENGICRNVTYERNRRVMQGYENSKGEKVAGLGNSLKYYKTAFVGKNDAINATDSDRIALAQKAGCLLSLAENTLEEIESSEFYQIFSNGKSGYSASTYTGIYFSGNFEQLSEFCERLEQLRNESRLNKINAYFFCQDNGEEFENEFSSMKNIAIKTIPETILKIYQALGM